MSDLVEQLVAWRQLHLGRYPLAWHGFESSNHALQVGALVRLQCAFPGAPHVRLPGGLLQLEAGPGITLLPGSIHEGVAFLGGLLQMHVLDEAP